MKYNLFKSLKALKLKIRKFVVMEKMIETGVGVKKLLMYFIFTFYIFAQDYLVNLM